jgi:hypothetical protein
LNDTSVTLASKWGYGNVELKFIEGTSVTLAREWGQ